MPELPEVETVKRGLEQTILGKTIRAVEVRVPKLFPDDQKLIKQVCVGAKVVATPRRGKVLLLGLSTDWTLAIHLKMTGQLIVVQSNQEKVRSERVAFVGGHPEKVYEQPLPHKHTHVILTFTDGTQLFFNDLRKFGWMRLFPREVVNHAHHVTIAAFLASLQLGPEPLSDDFTVGYFSRILLGRSIPIKQLLLEQKGIAGIGNIYADEALFHAGIRPTRPANSLDRPHSAHPSSNTSEWHSKASRGESEIRRLHGAIREVLELGIEHGGTSKNTYLTVEGTKGEMQDHLMVYGREGLPCKVCGAAIRRIKIGSRSSHFCPTCQT